MGDNMKETKDWIKEEEEQILKCNACDEEVEKCDECGKEFEYSQAIICFENGKHHFCSEECMTAFLNHNTIDAITYLDDA